jgi:hypothetical protein
MIKKIVFATLITLAVLIILLLLFLQEIGKRYVVKHSKELIGRQISIEKIRINYFTSTLKLTGFKLFEPDNETAFVSFDTLIVNTEPLHLINKELVIEQFYLKGLFSKVIRWDTTFNFDDMIAFFNKKEDTVAVDTSKSEPFKFRISNIELKQAEFVFDDKTIEKVTDLDDISFVVPYIAWNQEEASDAGIRFSFKNGGYLQSDIKADPKEGNFNANLSILNLNLVDFKEYVSEYAQINALSGSLDADLKISGNIFKAEKSVVSGSTNINGFAMEDKQDKKFIGATRLDCYLKKIDSYNMVFVLDSIILTEPYLYFELEDSTNNFYKIFGITDEVKDSTLVAQTHTDTIVTHSQDSLYYAINNLIIINGTIDYRDILTGEPFDYNLSEISLQADSLFSTSGWINLYAQMLLNKRGTLKAEIGFNPANPMDIDLDYVITDFQLGDLNIYSRFYMGFPVLYGDMYYKSQTKIDHNKLKSDNKLVIQNVELGNKSGGLYDLPLKFALFLLKDRHGVINLDIPVRGDLDDPTVSIGKIVWNTLKNLIIKVAAAPFDFLAGLINVDPNDIKSINYNYLDTTFTLAKQKQLDLLLELEQKKPGLKIELVYFNDLEKEKEQITMVEAGKLFNAETGGDYLADDTGFMEFLRTKTSSDSLNILDASKSLVAAGTVDSIAGLYAKMRKGSLESYLKTKNDSSLVMFSIPDLRSPKNTGSLPHFEVKYSMRME